MLNRRTFRTPLIALAALGLALTSIAFAQQQPPAAGNKKDEKIPPGDPNGTSIYDSLTFNPKRKTQAKGVEAHGKRWAVLIGVAQAWTPETGAQHPLPMCMNDAKTLGGILEKGGYETVILTDDSPDDKHKPTIENVMTAIDDVCTAAQENDQIFLYVSTHGSFLMKKPQLLLMDGRYDLETIKNAAAHSQALVRIIMLDACRVEGDAFSTETKECRDVHVILACRPDQSSQGGLHGLSLFTEAVVDGLTDCAADRIADGKIQLDELLYYAEDKLPSLLERDCPGEQQNPTRTIVDARAINPVMLMCPQPPANAVAGGNGNDNNQAAAGGANPAENTDVIATFEPIVASLINDMILTSDTAGKVTLGMTPAQVQEAMAIEPSIGFEPDAKGNDLVLYENFPKPGDKFWVFLLKGKVSRVIIQEANPCEGQFDRDEARRGARRLTGDKDYDQWSDLFKGLTKDQVRALMGCPERSATVGAENLITTWRYPQVPLSVLDLTIKFEGENVSEVALTPSKSDN